jgi:hypothetical protein
MDFSALASLARRVQAVLSEMNYASARMTALRLSKGERSVPVSGQQPQRVLCITRTFAEDTGPTSSGWPDLNRRPPRPKRGALAKLRYSPS